MLGGFGRLVVFASRTKNTTNSAMFVVFFGGFVVPCYYILRTCYVSADVVWLYLYFYEKRVARRVCARPRRRRPVRAQALAGLQLAADSTGSCARAGLKEGV